MVARRELTVFTMWSLTGWGEGGGCLREVDGRGELTAYAKARSKLTTDAFVFLQNIKIVGASCTTDYGEEYNLQVTQSGNSNEYECVCKGIGTTHPAIQSSQVNCILYYWECPIQAP